MEATNTCFFDQRHSLTSGRTRPTHNGIQTILFLEPLICNEENKVIIKTKSKSMLVFVFERSFLR